MNRQVISLSYAMPNMLSVPHSEITAHSFLDFFFLSWIFFFSLMPVLFPSVDCELLEGRVCIW